MTMKYIWPKYNGSNTCCDCLITSNCVSDDYCCVHIGKSTITMCSRCRLRKEVMLK